MSDDPKIAKANARKRAIVAGFDHDEALFIAIALAAAAGFDGVYSAAIDSDESSAKRRRVRKLRELEHAFLDANAARDWLEAQDA